MVRLWWSWSYGSWIYNYLCKQCFSSLTLRVQIRSWRGVVDTTYSMSVACDRLLFFSVWVILWQLFKIPSCVYMKGKFVTNVSFAKVRLINHSHSWDRIKCVASCFIKNIYFLRLIIPWGANICLYHHNTLNAHFLTFSST